MIVEGIAGANWQQARKAYSATYITYNILFKIQVNKWMLDVCQYCPFFSRAAFGMQQWLNSNFNKNEQEAFILCDLFVPGVQNLFPSFNLIPFIFHYANAVENIVRTV